MALQAFAAFPKAFCSHRESLQLKLPVLVTISSVYSVCVSEVMPAWPQKWQKASLCSAKPSVALPPAAWVVSENSVVQRLWLSLLYHWHYVCPWGSLSLESIYSHSGQHAFRLCQIQQGPRGFCSRWAAHVKKHTRSLLCLLQCLGWAMQVQSAPRGPWSSHCGGVAISPGHAQLGQKKRTFS